MPPPLTDLDYQAYFLLGAAEAVITAMLDDPTDTVARVQAERWLRARADLFSAVGLTEKLGPARPKADRADVVGVNPGTGY